MVQIYQTKTLKCLKVIATGLCPRKGTQSGFLGSGSVVRWQFFCSYFVCTYVCIFIFLFHWLQSAEPEYKALTISPLACTVTACLLQIWHSYVTWPWPQLSCSSGIQKRIQSICYASLQLCCFNRDSQWVFRAVVSFEGNISSVPCIKCGCMFFSTSATKRWSWFSLLLVWPSLWLALTNRI